MRLAGGHVERMITGADLRIEHRTNGAGEAVGDAVGTFDEIGTVRGISMDTA